MKHHKWFYGLIATVFALSLANADMASAQQGRGQGRGQGGGRGACMQTDQSNSQMCQPGQGRDQGGQGQRQRRRDGSCLNNPNTQAPTAIPAPAPSN